MTPDPGPGGGARGGAVLAVAAAGAGDLAGELLPDGVDQQHGAVAEDDYAVAVRPGGEVEGGSVRSGGLRYFPYGEERAATANNREKFATYFRDNNGLDYAHQRYYSSAQGRSLTPDPYMSGVDPVNPQQWNLYAYANTDPVNRYDPTGLNAKAPSIPGYCPPDLSYDECIRQGLISDGQGGDGGGGERGNGVGVNPCSNSILPNPACILPVIGPPPPPKEEKSPPCDPGFLNPAFSVTVSDGYTFSGTDINYAARVVFAEASGYVPEQVGVASVIYNRVDNQGFTVNGQRQYTLTAVVTAPKQFNAVTSPGPSTRFLSSAPGRYEELNPLDCYALHTAIAAMTSVASKGATSNYTFFAAASATTRGTLIGKTRFW